MCERVPYGKTAITHSVQTADCSRYLGTSGVTSGAVSVGGSHYKEGCQFSAGGWRVGADSFRSRQCQSTVNSTSTG